ncbi:MAG TPA: NAD(P)-binding domain-containing protein, partial [Telluria sp.]|nr:NAD(P)-binding domain-containing protein [Telluria sp.]
MTHIAFIGLGNMGRPMALNLVRKGFSLKVFDLSAEAMQSLDEAGAEVATSAADCVAGADIVLSMLPASHHVEGLYLGENGLLTQLPKGTLVIDCSTIAAASAIKVAEAALAAGLRMLDAPVSGGTAGAAAGTLTF